MDFLKFVVTAVLSSALVSAVLFAIIRSLTPGVRTASSEIDTESAMASRVEAGARLKVSERDRKIAV
jgi:hypothetical protein